MEQITRHIIKQRGKSELEYLFTTFDFVIGHDLEQKVKKMHPNVLKLALHIREAFKIGMPTLETSASQAKTLLLKVERLKDHEFTSMALAAGAKKGRGAHPTVQNYFMKFHKHAIAMELPVWGADMTALIDIVLIDPISGIVYILDYKPGAAQEKHAATQIYYDKKLLAENAYIPHSDIEAFYFDELNTYHLIS